MVNLAMELVGILMVFESPQRSEKTIRREPHGDGHVYGNMIIYSLMLLVVLCVRLQSSIEKCSALCRAT